MNKLHMLVLAGLIFCGVNNALAMGQEQMEVLHTLHALEQDFTQIPMIAQNIDMFMGVMEMNVVEVSGQRHSRPGHHQTVRQGSEQRAATG